MRPGAGSALAASLQLPPDPALTLPVAPAVGVGVAVGAPRIWQPATDLYKFSGRSTQVPVI